MHMSMVQTTIRNEGEVYIDGALCNIVHKSVTTECFGLWSVISYTKYMYVHSN